MLKQFLGLSMAHDLVITYLSNEQLAVELMRGTVRSWPCDGQLTSVSLSMNYAILHKIGIANWIYSEHDFTISTILLHLST